MSPIVIRVSDPRTTQRLVDAAVALLLAGIGVAEVWVPFSSVQGSGPRALTTVMVVLACLLLAARRIAPLPTALAVLLLWPVVFSLQPLLVLFWGQFVPMVVALFSVARHGRGREPMYGAMAGAAALLFMDLRVEVLQTAGEIVFHWLVFTVTWSAGRGLRVLEQRAADSQRRAVEVEVGAAERAMAAVVEERTRIARELHDVVAHALSVMVVQAGAAEQVVDDDPEHVRRALRTIRSTGTEALDEMRRVVSMLREADEAGARAPQPGLEQVEVLVDEVRSVGLDVELTVLGTSRSLPAGLDLTAYRILQEALTNVRRHASAGRARVEIRYGAEMLLLEVADDGTGPGSAEPGHGLIGMRERVALYGGRLDAGPGPGGGFRVHVELPLAPSRTTSA